MQSRFEFVYQLVNEGHTSFQTEILEELNGFLRIDATESYTVGSAISVFRLKEKMQSEEVPRVIGFSELLESLYKFKRSDFLHQLFIIGEHYGFLLFADYTKPVLHGALKFLDQRIDRNIELTENSRLRGTWTHSSFYLNGQRIESQTTEMSEEART